ncbi:hypothetical protein BGX21_005382 [Mortierella sp. AD011]|nr:hypothetical protein BGX20_005460 [Mortierella sp. AD010]KAF9399904.1 hypothetical protein BGX21_005382 [Mortierella sp. AD011]
MAIDLDFDKYLGRCFNLISDKECPNHNIDPAMVESRAINKVRIRVNYYSSSAEYDKNRNFSIDGGVSTPFEIVGLNMKYDKRTHESGRQNTSYYVYNCEVINYRVFEKRTGIKSKSSANSYIYSVQYGGYLRVIAEITKKHADVQMENFAELDVGLTEIHSSINIFTDFLRTKSDNHRYDTFRYHSSVEHSGHAEFSNIDADNMETVVSTFISNVQNNKRNSVALSYMYYTLDPSIIQINKKNYAFLRRNRDQIKNSSSPNTAPMLNKMDKLLKKLENADIVNQSQFDYHYARICDHHPELSSKLINFQFYTYVTKHKKIKEMPIHLLLLKVLDSARYNSNAADVAKIKTNLIQLEQLCSRHCDGEADEHFKERVNKYVDYADEKLKYADNQIENDGTSILSNHTYVEKNNIENTFMHDCDVIHNTFYSRHKIMRFLSKDKYVDIAYEFEASDVGWGALMMALSPFILLVSPYFLWQGLMDIRKRRLYSTKEFLENTNISYHNNLQRCMYLARDVYVEKSEYIEDNVANVSNYSVFSDSAKRYKSARDFFDSVKLIKSLRDLEINRFVIAVIGNTKVGKSSFLARLGLKSNARAGVHTKQITPHMLGGVMFLDFPGNDDTDEVIRNEFLQNYRTVDMCIVVSEINKASTDGVFSLIDKLRITNDIPYLVFLNHCDRVIDDDENDEELSVDTFGEIVNEKTTKVTQQFHQNGIKTLKIYPTSFKRNVRNLADYGVISVRDIMFIVKQLLDMEKIHYNEAQLFEHIGGCHEE